ncbi:MAG: hypothetical protein V1709_06775 [Planctomycetota bacterium]
MNKKLSVVKMVGVSMYAALLVGIANTASGIGELTGLPTGNAITLAYIADIIGKIARFLVLISAVIAVIMIVWSGVIWMTAGDSKRVDQAKATLKNGVRGALIVFGVGVIINTIAAVVTGAAFCSVGFLGVCVY